ncbi:MAG: chaperone NapD [Calditerrivibrio sp.]|nr:chaperone NapD [Calditerrivibrio sp.]
MIISGSVVACIEGSLKEVSDFLLEYPQIKVYAASEEKNSIIIVIEEETDAALQALCKKLQEHPKIIQISHHYFNFEDEIDKIHQGIPTDMSLKGFSKSEQRKERDKLSEY